MVLIMKLYAILFFFGSSIAFQSVTKIVRPVHTLSNSLQVETEAESKYFSPIFFADDKNKKDADRKYGWERYQELRKNKNKEDLGPPFYEPGAFPLQLAAALAYVIPIVDASDLGKYMFEAYPVTGEVYNLFFGTLAGVYNGVPFLPFALFFLMSYICRAPTFPLEVRFHFSQAFILSLIQFVPSFGFGLLEKAGVPGMGIAYNTAFLWVMVSCLFMQLLILLTPISPYKNPYLLNVLPWSLRYMNFRRGMFRTKR